MLRRQLPSFCLHHLLCELHISYFHTEYHPFPAQLYPDIHNLYIVCQNIIQELTNLTSILKKSDYSKKHQCFFHFRLQNPEKWAENSRVFSFSGSVEAITTPVPTISMSNSPSISEIPLTLAAGTHEVINDNSLRAAGYCLFWNWHFWILSQIQKNSWCWRWSLRKFYFRGEWRPTECLAYELS